MRVTYGLYCTNRKRMSGELDFIAALRAMASDPAARGLDDDAAVLTFGGETLVLTQDTIAQGIHVREDEDPADIAWKLVAVNLSDLAAKGALPLGVLISHMLGEGDARFLTGLAEVLERHDVALLGGDTIRIAGPRSWSCTAIGKASHTPVPDRRGARPGDIVHVTGVLGRAMLGFEPGERGSGSTNDSAYRRPTPLLAEGRVLAPLVTAMMDVSDGLLLDCWRMARASGVTFALEGGTVPVADPARRGDCLRWGDDYQLLFTTPPDTRLPVPATTIGLVRHLDTAALWLDGAVPDSATLGYRH